MTLFDLKGKVALITGSSRGIGRAIAEALADAGAHVVISSRNKALCEEVAQAIRASGGSAIAVSCNISEDEHIAALVDRTLGEWGRIDALVLNAAVNPYFGDFLETPDDAFDKTIRVNIRQNMRLCKLVLPQMAERGEGSVTVVSSNTAFKGSAKLGIYAVTKAADIQLVKNLAVAYGAKGIRANAIAPAVVKTDFARALWEDPERAEKVANSYALKRLGDPKDIAGAAVFLSARSGAWITGQTLVIDGGWSVLGDPD